ncbi:MAG: hypothetical protein R6V50_04045 [Thermoplasmatota archaeon]
MTENKRIYLKDVEEMNEIDPTEFLSNRFTWAFVCRGHVDEVEKLRKYMKELGMQLVFNKVSTHKLFISNNPPNNNGGRY